jgi:GNAT superfamily N-acetyltransferase
MFEIRIVQGDQHQDVLREIFWEYLQWVNERLGQEYGISYDIAAILERDMLDLSKYMPPSGRLLMASMDGYPVGVGCLKALGTDCGEIKRMYVRPDWRRAGLGLALVERLLAEAAQTGYKRVRLDSARFMEDAHRLYQKLGFRMIAPYEGSEIPPELHNWCVFMEKEI